MYVALLVTHMHLYMLLLAPMQRLISEGTRLGVLARLLDDAVRREATGVLLTYDFKQRRKGA